MRYGLFLLLFLLVSCSNIKFDTNVRPVVDGFLQKNVDDERVQFYSAEQIPQLNAATLGQVEAEQCQNNPDGIEPSEEYLISQLKGRVLQRGGNGLVLDRCVQYNSALCYSALRCNGLAIKAPD